MNLKVQKHNAAWCLLQQRALHLLGALQHDTLNRSAAGYGNVAGSFTAVDVARLYRYFSRPIYSTTSFTELVSTGVEAIARGATTL